MSFEAVAAADVVTFVIYRFIIVCLNINHKDAQKSAVDMTALGRSVTEMFLPFSIFSSL